MMPNMAGPDFIWCVTIAWMWSITLGQACIVAMQKEKEVWAQFRPQGGTWGDIGANSLVNANLLFYNFKIIPWEENLSFTYN